MATHLDSLLQHFLRERKYLRNVSPDTIEWYQCAWKAFRDSATFCLTDPAQLNRGHLEQFIYALRDRGVRPVTCNTWLRALNAFFRWLHENGHVPTRIHLRPLKVEKRLIAFPWEWRPPIPGHAGAWLPAGSSAYGRPGSARLLDQKALPRGRIAATMPACGVRALARAAVVLRGRPPVTQSTQTTCDRSR